jgi:tRNA threonylcarbamoyladenosine biosynthesis protein TsaE
MIGVASKAVEPDDFPIKMLRRARSPEEMEALGREAAASAAAGTVIALVGGLGAGKTHWCKGFVAGIGSAAEVTSPTFGLVHEYSGGRLPVFHFDFYRLDSPEELLALGWDEYLEADGVILAEWGDKFPEVLPPETVWIQFATEEDGSRTLTRADI